MITEIKIFGTASYTQQQEKLENLAKINFIFGNNGSGKTTIGRIIKNSTDYPQSNLKWHNNTPLNIYLYNQDFIEQNFKQSNNGDLKGIFRGCPR